MSGTKVRGTAVWMAWITQAGATVDIYTENRSFDVTETAKTIDVTVRGDSAKASIADVPDIKIDMGGLDTSGTPAWDTIHIGDKGTVIWAPSGTATGERKKSLKATITEKGSKSASDGLTEWKMSVASDGGTVVSTTW